MARRVYKTREKWFSKAEAAKTFAEHNHTEPVMLDGVVKVEPHADSTLYCECEGCATHLGDLPTTEQRDADAAAAAAAAAKEQTA